MLFYTPWRQRIDRKRQVQQQPQEQEVEDGITANSSPQISDNDDTGPIVHQPVDSSRDADAISKVPRE